MNRQNPNKYKNLVLKSDIFGDPSRNLFPFHYKKNFHGWGGEKNGKIKKTLQLKKNLNGSRYILHMKIDNIINNMRRKRQYNKALISYNYSQISNEFQNIGRQPYIINREPLLTTLKKINEDFNKVSFSFNSMCKPNQFALPAPLPRPIIIKKQKVNIDAEINNISDLIDLCKKYPLKDDIEYNIDMKTIHNIREPLEQLDEMIGMKKLKESIVNQILFFAQKLHINNKGGSDFMHTVIYGPPGTGKTEIAKIMGRIFSKLNILSSGKFLKVTRADLIAGYLGQTAIKTKEVMQKCLGGVLFIDEAYSLGNNEKRDSFAKECIDTLCEGLSDYKDNLMVIIVGYKKELNDCFFNYNEGLNSRFTWRFHIDNYTPDELKSIFKKKVTDAGWEMKRDIKVNWFKKNMDYFKYFGRDMETLFAKTKIAHSRRVFCKDKEEKTKITMVDLKKGLEMFLDNDEVKNRKNNQNTPMHLYL